MPDNLPQTQDAAPSGDVAIWRPSAALNPARMDYLWTLSEKIAASSIVPESLRCTGPKNAKKDLDWPVVVANVFAVVEQADRWNQSPFALLAAASIVHGRLGFEGKAIAAVMEANYGIALHHYFTGQPGTDDYHIYLCDEELPADVVKALAPKYRHPLFDIMDGSVSEWKTTGDGSPWRPATYNKMLVYRGTREWARVYKPAAIMGILADDELQEIALEAAATRANDLSTRFGGASGGGFSPDNVQQLESSAQQPMETVQATAKEPEPATKTEAPKAKTEPKAAPKPAAEHAPKADAAAAKPAADGAQLDLGDQKTTPPSASPKTADGAAGGETATPYRLSAEEFQNYHSALSRMSSVDSVVKADATFWKGNRPPRHPDDIQLCKDIWENHKHRADGKIALADLNKEVPAWIAKVAGATAP